MIKIGDKVRHKGHGGIAIVEAIVPSRYAPSGEAITGYAVDCSDNETMLEDGDPVFWHLDNLEVVS